MPPNVNDQALARATRAARIKAPVILALMAVILFGGSGSIGWSAAWLYILLMAATQAGTFFMLRKVAPDLLVERSRLQSGTKPWDKCIAPLVAIAAPLVTLTVAALDTGGGWVNLPLQLAGFAVVSLGILLMLWAMAANRFFAATVRIQTDRGHSVVSGGPYAYVRHPGYVGLIAYIGATPVALGSWRALWPAALGVALVVVRTALEDRTLRLELPGYEDYARRVRARLLPAVW